MPKHNVPKHNVPNFCVPLVDAGLCPISACPSTMCPSTMCPSTMCPSTMCPISLFVSTGMFGDRQLQAEWSHHQGVAMSKCSVKEKKTNRPLKFPCPYEVVWRQHTKRGETFWDLDTQKSFLQHSTFCPSGQHVTAKELAADTNFTTHLQEGDACTGKQAKAFAERDGNRLHGSVSLRTVYRVKADVLNQSERYYKDDWCKLQNWRREFLAMNPGSVCDIQVDPTTQQ